MKSSTYGKPKPAVLFINPSLGTKSFTRADVLRSYLSLGTLASAILSRPFINKFTSRLGIEHLSVDLESLPVFDARVVQLSLRGTRSVEDYLSPIIGKCNPFMVCVTATSAQLQEAYEVAASVSRLALQCLLVIGGPHVSVRPFEFLAKSKFHVACIGEGTETLVELALRQAIMEHPAFSDIPGIAYKGEKSEVRLNKPREYLLELDEYPFPSESLHLFLDDIQDTNKNGQDIAYVLAGLGCPFDCSFCAQKSIHRGGIRERSADNLFEEIKGLWSKGFRRFAVVQETFFVRKARADSFVRLITESALSIEWTAEARADQLDRESLVRYRNAGLRMVQIGLESGDQKLLDKVGKTIRLEKVKDVIDWCRELKINTALYLLVGLPRQDWQSILKTALFLRENMPYNPGTMHSSVAIAIPYPGTVIEEKQSVRIVGRGRTEWDWPARTPDITVSREGEFLGEAPTETDDMAQREIFEAMLYLDDFIHFSLHAQYDRSLHDHEKARSLDFAHRMFYMMERRTIRDLIVRSQTGLTPEKRNRAYKEILRRDGGREEHFKEVTASPVEHPPVFTELLTKIGFENGYDAMKQLSVPNRIKLMSLISNVWGCSDRSFDKVRYELDSEDVGIALNGALDGSEGESLESQGGSDPVCLHGFDFELVRDDRTLVINRHSFESRPAQADKQENPRQPVRQTHMRTTPKHPLPIRT